jgi:diadenosine tetraphosphate (Ap4A) HIT family hydrolase
MSFNDQGKIMNDCQFCPPALNQNEIILENALCLFLQNEGSAVAGSGLIVPRTHSETVFDLSHAEWTATFDLLHTVKEYLDGQHHPAGYNLGWNCGSVGGQKVFHAHLHVIARFGDEPFAGRGIRYWFMQDENKRPQSKFSQ